MALKWETKNKDLQQTFFGPFIILLKRDVYLVLEGQDPWTVSVSFGECRVLLDAGERYLTQEQAKDATIAWCMGVLNQMTSDVNYKP